MTAALLPAPAFVMMAGGLHDHHAGVDLRLWVLV